MYKKPRDYWNMLFKDVIPRFVGAGGVYLQITGITMQDYVWLVGSDDNSYFLALPGLSQGHGQRRVPSQVTATWSIEIYIIYIYLWKTELTERKTEVCYPLVGKRKTVIDYCYFSKCAHLSLNVTFPELFIKKEWWKVGCCHKRLWEGSLFRGYKILDGASWTKVSYSKHLNQ